MYTEFNESAISKRLRVFLRTNSDCICELACERREVSSNLDKLKKAIEADPHNVSEHHKGLWVKQVEAMQAYVNVLSERIKALIDSDT